MMDNAQWIKVCKDSGVIDGSRFTQTDADILFAKIKHDPHARRIDHDMFKQCLAEAGAALFADLDADAAASAAEKLVTDSGGPTLHATEADHVRLADDIAAQEAHRKEMMEVHEKRRAEHGGSTADSLLQTESFYRGSAEANSAGPGEHLKRVFLAFCHSTHDAADIDVNGWIRLLRDCDLLSQPRKFNATEAELIFVSVVTKGAKKIDFRQFKNGLQKVSEKLHGDMADAAAYEKVCKAVVDTGGPAAGSGTRADAVHLADDIAKMEEAKHEKDAVRERRRSRTGASDSTAIEKQRRRSHSGAALTAEPGTLKHTFLQFGAASHTHGSTGAEIDNSQFIHLLKDCGLINKKKFTTTDADLLWTATITKGSRRMDYPQFVTAVKGIAAKLHKGMDDKEGFAAVESKIIETGGPKAHGATAAEAPKFRVDARGK